MSRNKLIIQILNDDETNLPTHRNIRELELEINARNQRENFNERNYEDLNWLKNFLIDELNEKMRKIKPLKVGKEN